MFLCKTGPEGHLGHAKFKLLQNNKLMIFRLLNLSRVLLWVAFFDAKAQETKTLF